jgi:tetratricopeptide (TPR) repeat protein
MREALKHIEEIEDYFEGKLSPEDKLLFEARLESNPELTAEFTLYKQIRGAIVDKGKDELKLKFALADQELDTVPVILISNKTNYKLLAIAASILLVIGISMFWLLNKKSDYSALASKYYEAEKGLPVQMGTAATFDKLMNSYKSGNYTDARQQVVELLKGNSGSDTLVYFNAVINDELKNYPSAINNYSSIPATSNYYEKAQYRLVLAYLKTNEKAKAIEVLNKAMTKKDHLFYDKLNQLKAELSE